MPTVHTVLKILREKLRYGKLRPICHGFAILWLQAVLCEEEILFDNRINHLISPETNLDNLAENTPTDLLAFFDSLELFHFPLRHNAVFSQSPPLTQLKIEQISPYASSEKIEKQGGLVHIYSQLFIPTAIELETYLKGLTKLMEATIHSHKIGILICSPHHTQALQYISNGWKMMDVNRYPSKFINHQQLDHIAQEVLLENKYLPLSIYFVSTKKNLELFPEFKHQLACLSNSFAITPEIAQREKDGETLLHTAAEWNKIDLIDSFIKNGGNPDSSNNIGETAAHLALRNGNAEFIKALAKYPANFNQGDQWQLSPAFIPAMRGHVQGILALDTIANIDFNKQDDLGWNILDHAIYWKHISIVNALSQCAHPINLNSKTRKEQKTAIDHAFDSKNDKINDKIVELLLRWMKKKHYSALTAMSSLTLKKAKIWTKNFPDLNPTAFSLYIDQNKPSLKRKYSSHSAPKTAEVSKSSEKIKNADYLSLEHLTFFQTKEEIAENIRLYQQVKKVKAGTPLLNNNPDSLTQEPRKKLKL